MINLDKKYGTRKISQKEKQISVEFFKQSSGISYLKSEILCNGRIKIDRQKSKKYLFLMFNEAKNDLCFKLDRKEYILNKDEFCIGLVNDDFKGVFEYQNKFYKTKTLLFDESYANKLEIFAGLRFDDKFELLKYKKDLAQICVLNELETTNLYEGAMREIFTESKILELIYNEFSRLKCPNKNVILDEADKNALQKARQILSLDIKNPPSIKELSKQVRLNEFKLKVGFKSLFGQTPYEFLREERMKRALAMLQGSELNIAEISAATGFKNQSHFSKLFCDYYGTAPKNLMKNRKYYY